MSSKVLIATAKNEGPFIWEWVAHHLSIGFDSLIIFQNDSDDFTHEILKELQRIGLIKYKYNKAGIGRHQVRAYTRAARQPEYLAAEWAMALDLDEFLFIKTGDGTLDCLLSEIPDSDEIMINWRMFGSSGHVSMAPDLVTRRFTAAELGHVVKTNVQPFKTFFRRSSFERAGIHKPRHPTRDELKKYNGSGLPLSEFNVRNFQCSDPKCRALAQVHHYLVKDPQSFVLKNVRGSAHQAHRDVSFDYWRKGNRNRELDLTAMRFETRLQSKMLEIDRLSEGKISELTAKAYRAHELAFSKAIQNEHSMELYQYCVRTSQMEEQHYRHHKIKLLDEAKELQVVDQPVQTAAD